MTWLPSAGLTKLQAAKAGQKPSWTRHLQWGTQSLKLHPILSFGCSQART